MRAMFLAMLIASGVAMAADDKAPAPQAPAAPAASEPAKPAADAAPASSETSPAKSEQRILTVEKSNAPPKCVIKPVMTDDELRACGARIDDKGTR